MTCKMSSCGYRPSKSIPSWTEPFSEIPMTLHAISMTRLILVGAVAFLFTACATISTTPEDAVTERAQQRWDTLLEGDIEGAYEYFSPGYRTGYSLLDFQRKLILMRMKWTGANVIESNCSSNSCKVRISVDYKVYGALPGVSEFKGNSLVEEDWILVDRQWYLLPEK